MRTAIVDSHAHLDFPDFEKDLDAVLARAREAGVTSVLTVGTNLETSKRCLELSRRFDDVSATVGIHPHDAMGLDYFRDRSPREAQREAFRAQLRLAASLDLPVIIHSREAWPETFGLLSEETPPRGGVVHCFSGGEAEAAQALSLGFHVSFAGPITYRKADRTRAIAASVPADRLLLETDAPFLAPQSIRGKRNEPAHVVEVAFIQARLHHLELPDIASVTTLNARKLFGLGPTIPREKIAYPIRDSLYVNLTNRCSSRCVFCHRETRPVVTGHDLSLQAEPTTAEVREAVTAAEPEGFREIVFCGYGEPTLRLETVLALGREWRGRGHRVRLNTNGTANLIHGRDVTPELSEAVDELSVSLNAQDGETFERLCRPSFGPKTYAGILDFVKRAKGRVKSITLTALDGLEGVDIAACRAAAEGLGVGFRARAYRG
ncbi:MAG: TatD family nuclease-associated radical SAM protein [Planctomycetota bacterium]|jgi:TatD DNase family protein